MSFVEQMLQEREWDHCFYDPEWLFGMLFRVFKLFQEGEWR
jgi:hypothetical protein